MLKLRRLCRILNPKFWMTDIVSQTLEHLKTDFEFQKSMFEGFFKADQNVGHYMHYVIKIFRFKEPPKTQKKVLSLKAIDMVESGVLVAIDWMIHHHDTELMLKILQKKLKRNH